ncbi:hypothetical protein KKH23_09410 [Patescibacteria group bacterium]|nr:hypothetical protein [Patescibacteria group bacterium]MBU0847386.1 hypothetical protein [Patescibacteria group bacterium]
MVMEEAAATAEERPEEVAEATPPGEPSKVSLHIYMPTEAYEQIKKWARYAALEGLIEGHPRGNFTDYCNFCFNLGEQYLKQYMLKKRGYK